MLIILIFGFAILKQYIIKPGAVCTWLLLPPNKLYLLIYENKMTSTYFQ